jgi:HK97 gp10 family phage protein
MPFLALDVQIQLQGTLIARINNAAKGGVRELMDNVVLPAAQSMCKVGDEKREIGEVATAESLSTLTRQRGNKIEAFIRSNSGHGGYLEKGTAKMSAEPYMQPAFEQSVPALNEILVTRFAALDELETLIEDGGITGLQSAVNDKSKVYKASKVSRAMAKRNAAMAKADKEERKYRKEHGGRSSKGPARQKRKYVRTKPLAPRKPR